MEMKNHSIELTRNWVEKFVIQLNLCPFAKHPFQNGLIRYSEKEYSVMEKSLAHFWQEILLIKNSGRKSISNSLLIYPNGLGDFLDYLDFLDLCGHFLDLQNESENFQLASFHPDYQFAESEINDAKNFSNRSPFPMIHILRTEEVEEAIEYHPDTLQIPETNQKNLEEIGSSELAKILVKFSKK